MTLTEVIERYCLTREVSPAYQYQLEWAARRLSKSLGRDATTGDLDPRVISVWLRDEQNAGRMSARSRRNMRASLMTIARAADSPLHTQEVRQVKLMPRSPQAWEPEELASVVEASQTLPGQLANGIRRAEYFPAVLWFAFETGLRRRDVWDFDSRTMGSDRRASLTQHKSRAVHVVEVTRSTYADMMRIANRLQTRGDKKWFQPFRWPQEESAFYYWLAKARAIAGIDPKVANRALQHVRRTGATAVEREQRDAATKYLGHRSGGALAWASYIDPRMVRHTIMPPTVRPNEPAARSSAGSDQSYA